MRQLAILGASGHGKVVADAAMLSNKWSEIIFFDDAFPDVSSLDSWLVVGDTNALVRDKALYEGVVVAIGDNAVRLSKLQYLIEQKCNIVSVFHPSSTISSSASILAGTVVLAGAVVNPCASIGFACIINSNAVIEHDCVLYDGVHVSPMVAVAGGAKVGQCSWLGIGSCVRQNINITSNVIVGAGGVVVNDLPNSGVYIGAPVKVLTE